MSVKAESDIIANLRNANIDFVENNLSNLNLIKLKIVDLKQTVEQLEKLWTTVINDFETKNYENKVEIKSALNNLIEDQNLNECVEKLQKLTKPLPFREDEEKPLITQEELDNMFSRIFQQLPELDDSLPPPTVEQNPLKQKRRSFKTCSPSELKTCYLCPKSFVTTRAWKKHNKQVHRAELPLPNFDFGMHSLLANQHPIAQALLMQPMALTPSVNQNVLGRKRRSFKTCCPSELKICYLCPKSFVTTRAWKKHNKQIHRAELPLPNFDFGMNSLLTNQHAQNSIPQALLMQPIELAPSVNQNVSKRKRRSLKTCHPAEIKRCFLCQKGFLTTRSLKCHIKKFHQGVGLPIISTQHKSANHQIQHQLPSAAFRQPSVINENEINLSQPTKAANATNLDKTKQVIKIKVDEDNEAEDECVVKKQKVSQKMASNGKSNQSKPKKANKEYEVEKIVDYKQDLLNRKLEDLLYVKWKTYSKENNTWEPPQNVLNCKARIKAYLKKIKKQRNSSCHSSEWDEKIDGVKRILQKIKQMA